MLALTSILRIVFIITHFLYEMENHPAVINLIHIDWIWLYLICWGVELIHDLFATGRDIVTTVLKFVKKSNEKEVESK